MSSIDAKEAARLALSDALKDPRTGFGVKVGMMGGAYEAFSEAVEAAILKEREQWKDAAEASFNEGVAQERERCAEWCDTHNSTMLAADAIRRGDRP